MTPERLKELKERSGAASTFERNIGFCGLGEDEAKEIFTELDRLLGEPFTCGHESQYAGGACAVCHVQWIDRAQKAELQNGELKRLLAEAMKHHLCIQSPCYCLDAWNALNSVTEKQMENGAECLRLAIAERESLKLRVGELKETLRWLGINHAHNAPCPQCMAIAKALTEKQNATGSQYLSGPLGPEGPVAEKQDGEPPNNSPPLSGGESVKCGCCGTIFACNCDCPGS